MNKFIFILSILIVNQVFAKCDTAEILIIDDPKDVVEVDPSTLSLSFYDEKLNEANVKGYKAFSKNGGNLGIGAIEIEQLIFDLVDDENIKLCAGLSYARVFNTTSVGFDLAIGNSQVRSEKAFELCPPLNYEKELPYFDHICNVHEGDGKFYNLSKKNKGTKGNASNAVIYSTADFKHKNGSELSCVALSTMLESNYPGYYLTYINGSFCTSDNSYLSKEKIKSLAKSIGVYGTADPPMGMRLNFHK